MNRRNFVAMGATSLCALPFVGFSSVQQESATKPTWLLEWIKIHDQQLLNISDIRYFSCTKWIVT